MKEAKLSLETAKEMYKQGCSAKSFALDNYTEKELTEKKLPTTWEECIKEFDRGYYFNLKGKITEYSGFGDKNDLPTKELAEQTLALMELLTWREIYRQGWKPDWRNSNKKKYVICKYLGEYDVFKNETTMSTLSFQDKETAELFLKNFRPLIEKAGDLI